MNTIGWIGSILLAFCGLPSAIDAWRKKDSPIPWSLLLLWGFGEIFVLLPIITKIKEPFLIFNYTANILFVGFISYYKLRSKYK